MDQLPLLQKSSAEFSPCRKYRYSLWRIWDRGKPIILFIGLNPSTADEVNNDPTITREIGYALDWGYGGLVMCNIFAFRAPKRKDMKKADNPIGGKLNDLTLKLWHVKCDLTIAAWGIDGAYLNRGQEVFEMLNPLKSLYCLFVTQGGYPGHPLYLRKGLKPILYGGLK